jgi:hypothetical protein
MPTVTFDTLKFVEVLKSHGFAEEQAKGMAEAIRDVQAAHLQDVVTKADLQALELRMESKLVRIEGEITLIKWMLGILIAGVLSLVVKAFF